MSFNVRLFGYSGIVQVGHSHAQQYTGDAVFLNEEPCLWSQILVCDGSTVATSTRITTVPDGTQMVCVEVPDDHEIRYEVVQPGAAARAVSSNSRRGSGLFNLAWSPGYTLSIVDAVPVAIALPVEVPVLNAPSIIRPLDLRRPPRPPQPYNSALYASDPFLGNVVLLMGFPGTNGDTGAPGMTDESPAAHGTATRSLDSPTISSAYAKFGATSLNLPGASGISFADSADWAFGSGNYTVEMSIKPTAIAGLNMFLCGQWDSSVNLSWVLYLLAGNGHISMITSSTGTSTGFNINGTTAIIANSTHTVCVDFDGTKTRVYLDGVMEAFSTTLVTLFDSTFPLTIGNGNSNVGPYTGFVDEIRITKGVARYASDLGYTPATAAFPRV